MVDALIVGFGCLAVDGTPSISFFSAYKTCLKPNLIKKLTKFILKILVSKFIFKDNRHVATIVCKHVANLAGINLAQLFVDWGSKAYLRSMGNPDNSVMTVIHIPS